MSVQKAFPCLAQGNKTHTVNFLKFEPTGKSYVSENTQGNFSKILYTDNGLHQVHFRCWCPSDSSSEQNIN